MRRRAGNGEQGTVVVVCAACGAVMPAGSVGPIAGLLWHQRVVHGREPGAVEQ